MEGSSTMTSFSSMSLIGISEAADAVECGVTTNPSESIVAVGWGSSHLPVCSVVAFLEAFHFVAVE